MLKRLLFIFGRGNSARGLSMAYLNPVSRVLVAPLTSVLSERLQESVVTTQPLSIIYAESEQRRGTKKFDRHVRRMCVKPTKSTLECQLETSTIPWSLTTVVNTVKKTLERWLRKETMFLKFCKIAKKKELVCMA